VSLNIDDQTDTEYEASGQTEDGTNFTLTGTVDDEGGTSGSITYSSPDGTSGDGTYTGIFTDDDLSLSYNTTDLVGDTCVTVGTASLQRSSSSDETNQALKQFSSAGTVSVLSSYIQHQNLALRQMKLRQEARKKVDVSGLNFNIDGHLFSAGTLAALLLNQQANDASADNTSISSRLGFFATGTVSMGEHDETSGNAGFDFTTSGLTIGSDYPISENFYLGGALGYSRVDNDFDQATGGLDVDGYSLSLYSTYSLPNGYYMDGIIRAGWSNYQQDRKFTFNNAMQKASAEYDSFDYSLSLSAGYELASGAWNLQPYARIDYVKVDIESFDEEAETADASTSLLTIDDQSISSLKSALGGQFSYALSTRSGVFSPFLRFEWQHEFKDDSRRIKSRLVSNPTVLTSLETDNPDRDFFNLGTGISAVFPNGVLGFLYYEYLLSHRDISQHTINGGIRLEF
jgi:outer membrane autotransporter protein